MTRLPHPTRIDIPAEVPTQAPDDDVLMAYDGPLDVPAGAVPDGSEIPATIEQDEDVELDDDQDGQEMDEQGVKREVPLAARIAEGIKRMYASLNLVGWQTSKGC
jgi:hypothetical protein